MDRSLQNDKDLQSDSPSLDWPIGGSNTTTTHDISPEQTPSPTETYTSSSSSTPPNSAPLSVVHASNYPGGRKSLSAIALRAFLLGIAFGICSLITFYILVCVPYILPEASHSSLLRLWRPAFFLGALSVFHFLEFYITALRNTPYANVSAFLLSTNGRAYNAAHTAALIECTIVSIFFPTFQDTVASRASTVLGLVVLLVGQFTRTTAMSQAGTNFNHTVQTKRNDGHVLVTSGIYGWLRHPSYFGFFWWGVGTQVVLGNVVCGMAYTVILWGFFRRRIRKEEELLVKFFGAEYQQYRRKSGVGIPFIG